MINTTQWQYKKKNTTYVYNLTYLSNKHYTQ